MLALRRTRVLLSLLILVIAPSAEGGVISLAPAPFVGDTSDLVDIELTVTYERNGVAATNLVSHALSIGFTGLQLVPAGTHLGDVYADLTMDSLLDLSEGPLDCAATLDCTAEVLAAHAFEYRSAAVVFPPEVARDAGTLVIARFVAAPLAAAWALDVFGDEASALYWEPPFICSDDPEEPVCGSQPEFVPFALVRAGSDVQTPEGTAILSAAVRVTTRPPGTPVSVPDQPSTLLLLALGVSGVALCAMPWSRSPR